MCWSVHKRINLSEIINTSFHICMIRIYKRPVFFIVVSLSGEDFNMLEKTQGKCILYTFIDKLYAVYEFI